MYIVSIKLFDPRVGYCIYAKEVSNSDYLCLIKLIRNLGLKRDLQKEVRGRALGGNITLKPADPTMIDKYYSSTNTHFDISYFPELQTTAFVWKSPITFLSGEELASMWLSEINNH